MPQDAEVIDTGRVMMDGERTVLVRDDGGAWTLFFETNPASWLGERVTVRGRRYDFASLHVTGVARGNGQPPPARAVSRWIWLMAAPIALGVALSLLGPVQTLWRLLIDAIG